MDAIISAGTRSHPEVVLDREKEIYRISGISVPEDAFQFYSPIIEWLKNELPSIRDGSVFSFRLSYFTSSSMKALYLALLEIKKSIDGGKHLDVLWCVDDEDEFMQEAGDTLAELTGIRFTFTKGPKATPGSPAL